MVAHAEKRGLGGIVIYGAIRDYATLSAGTFPVFAAGVTPRGPYKDGPGEINVPVAIDGMVVEPGDLMLGDDDGLLCVPHDLPAQLCKAAEEKQAAEEKKMVATKAGNVDRSWVEAAPRKLGCEGVR